MAAPDQQLRPRPAHPGAPSTEVHDREEVGDRTSARLWDEDLTGFIATSPQDPPAWRRYCDALHLELLRRWAPTEPIDRALKTDLFDEAAGTGLADALSTTSKQVVGIDLSTTAAVAAHRLGVRDAVRADVRRLPFADHAFDLVVSNSTLDHLPDAAAIDEALAELLRVTQPGGTAIITLDNPRCPTVALRAVLPERWLRATGLIPYEMGATLSLSALERAVERVGFRVDDRTTYMHVLRVTALRSAGRSRNPDEWVERSLDRERRARRSTAQLTGHFVAVRAVRPGGRG